ncbi:MAG: PD-(D/E)XK nuclease-like domain-containing protein, partial [Pseudomonadaceae bacterium]|nr:PD-(D/E)XK nuclease-like domain-containing protein [Pseudomonadaceae bacterium]
RLRQQQLRANGIRQRTPKYEFGTAVHAAVLEPQRFKQTYLTHPGNKAKSTKSFKEFELANPGKRVLMLRELNDIIGCANSLRSATVIRTHSAAFTMADLVDLGTPERNYYWLDAQTGLTCKARMDLTIENIVIDVKTAPDARGERFKWDAAKFGYHIQAAFYMEGFAQFQPEGKEIIMTFLVGEKLSPYGSVVYQADKDTFWAFGKRRVRELLAQYQRCLQAQSWPGYAQGPQLLKLPLNKLYADPKYNLPY